MARAFVVLARETAAGGVPRMNGSSEVRQQRASRPPGVKVGLVRLRVAIALSLAALAGVLVVAWLPIRRSPRLFPPDIEFTSAMVSKWANASDQAFDMNVMHARMGWAMYRAFDRIAPLVGRSLGARYVVLAIPWRTPSAFSQTAALDASSRGYGRDYWDSSAGSSRVNWVSSGTDFSRQLVRQSDSFGERARGFLYAILVSANPEYMLYGVMAALRVGHSLNVVTKTSSLSVDLHNAFVIAVGLLGDMTCSRLVCCKDNWSLPISVTSTANGVHQANRPARWDLEISKLTTRLSVLGVNDWRTTYLSRLALAARGVEHIF